jgi:hypothetical protein
MLISFLLPSCPSSRYSCLRERESRQRGEIESGGEEEERVSGEGTTAVSPRRMGGAILCSRGEWRGVSDDSGRRERRRREGSQWRTPESRSETSSSQSNCLPPSTKRIGRERGEPPSSGGWCPVPVLDPAAGERPVRGGLLLQQVVVLRG